MGGVPPSSPNYRFLQIFKTILLKYDWTALLDIRILGISASRSFKQSFCFMSIRGVTQNFGNFQNEFTQKRLDGRLRYYDFWNQRIEIYHTGVFLGRSEASPQFLEFFKTILLKNGWTALLEITFFGVSPSRFIKKTFWVDYRCHPKSWKF